MTADRIDAFLDLLGSAMRAGPPEASCQRMRDVAEAFARESASAALAELAAGLDERAASYRRSPDATEQMARHARAAIQAAAEMARQRARGDAGETDGHSPASLPGRDGSEAHRGAESRRGWDQ